MRKNAAYYPQYNDLQVKEFSVYLSKHIGIVRSLVNKSPFIKRHEREDYCQEAIIYAWRRFYLYDKSLGSFAGWLYKTAEWGIKKYARTVVRLQKNTYYQDPQSSWYDIADETYDESLICGLRKAIEDLPENDRNIVELFLSDTSSSAISMEMGKHSKFISDKISRIKKHIRNNRHKYFEDVYVDLRKFENSNTGRKNEQNELSIPVVMLNMEGTFIKRFPSLNDVGRQGFSVSGVWKICNGKGYSYKGYRWIYEGESRPAILSLLQKKPPTPGASQKRAVEQYDQQGNLVKRFESMAEATRSGFNAGNIIKNLKGEISHYKGFNWKYGVDDPA